VLNGINCTEWDPAADNALPASYSQTDPSGKKRCKQALISHCAFTGKSETPVLSFIGRLSEQKGITLLAGSINELIRRGLKLFILGKGDARLEKLLREYAGRYPGDMYFMTGFDDTLAHLAYAGSDIFLMPSVYEPCGLGQMIAMRYGTVPVAFNTGGLADSMTAANKETDKTTDYKTSDDEDVNGFLFNEHSLPSFLAEISRALRAYGNRTVWERIVRSAMRTDFSWTKSAAKYLELYKGTRRHA
jgi:starch synthase